MNEAQIAEWNGEQGRRWVELQRAMDAMLEPFSQAALQAAAAQPGEKVIDIGCGCGSTSLALARAVAPHGSVLGVDVSQPMLVAARELAASVDGLNLSFTEADAADADLPHDHDLLFSRFGLMFFATPAAALRHLRGALRPLGRCAFVCWRAPRNNAWAMTPLVAARAALGVTPPPADPLAPGPFAFADDKHLHDLLREAGFSRIDIRSSDAMLRLGATARGAAEHSARIGPVSRLVREAGAAKEALIVEAIEQVLTPLAGADGSIKLAGSVWVVTASNAG
ncbi:MAG: class I SAM-dependent methyltransferase [Rubrivivax sp.]